MKLYDVFCQTTKTCSWRQTRIEDHEAAIELGRQHAIDDHPTKTEWRIRVLTRRYSNIGLSTIMERAKAR